MPAHERSRFEAIIANLVRTRVLPAELRPADRTAYHHALMSGDVRSPASRYRRLSEDVAADLKLIGPFAAVAGRVVSADSVRLRSLSYVRDLDEAQTYHAVARVAENRCLIAWVRYETLTRIESYHYALEHLIIEAPQNEAIAAERSLAKLEGHRHTIDPLLGPLIANGVCAGTDEQLYATPLAAPPVAGIAAGREPLVTKD
jgi:hypothetical protein